MTTCTSYDLVEYGQPFERFERELAAPSGSEVIIAIKRSGVCHSDVHLLEGFFDLGEEGRQNVVDAGVQLPVTLGHEIVGEVGAVGPEATDIEIGSMQLVFPWIGCGACTPSSNAANTASSPSALASSIPCCTEARSGVVRSRRIASNVMRATR